MFYSVYSLDVSNSLITASFTTGKILLIIDLYDAEMNFFVMIIHSFDPLIHITYLEWHNFFALYNLLGIAKIYYFL